VVVPEEADLIVQLFENVAAGATLYSEAKRLNGQEVPSPGYRFRDKPRKHGTSWSHTTVGEIIRQLAYTGTHVVKINGGAGSIEREVPAIVAEALRQKALKRLRENKRYAGGLQGKRNYLLSGLIECARCGRLYRGTSLPTSGKCYYYVCVSRRASYDKQVKHARPYVNAHWLEDLVWQDVRGFLENPGEVLERVREQFEGDDQASEMEERRESLQKRLASKQAERDRAMRLYMRGLISEEEVDVLLADLMEADLSKKEESKLTAMNTEAWLMSLRKNLSEVKQDTQEAYLHRRELVKLLVEKIAVDRNEDGRAKIDITYRFGPPPEESTSFVSRVQNSL
jgi:site-specific DNA recombinase